MAHFVVLTDGSVADEGLVAEASRRAGRGGAVVLISVLAGSLVSGMTPPAVRGRRRRELENEAAQRLRDLLLRLEVDCEAQTVALFGDPVEDTLLLANNLGADAVIVRTDSPSLGGLRQMSSIPVLTVPQAEAPA